MVALLELKTVLENLQKAAAKLHNRYSAAEARALDEVLDRHMHCLEEMKKLTDPPDQAVGEQLHHQCLLLQRALYHALANQGHVAYEAVAVDQVRALLSLCHSFLLKVEAHN